MVIENILSFGKENKMTEIVVDSPEELKTKLIGNVFHATSKDNFTIIKEEGVKCAKDTNFNKFEHQRCFSYINGLISFWDMRNTLPDEQSSIDGTINNWGECMFKFSESLTGYSERYNTFLILKSDFHYKLILQEDINDWFLKGKYIPKVEVFIEKYCPYEWIEKVYLSGYSK